MPPKAKRRKESVPATNGKGCNGELVEEMEERGGREGGREKEEKGLRLNFAKLAFLIFRSFLHPLSSCSSLSSRPDSFRLSRGRKG